MEQQGLSPETLTGKGRPSLRRATTVDDEIRSLTDLGSTPNTSTMKPSIEILRANEGKFYERTGQRGACRVWLGGLNEAGYGEFQFRHGGRKYKIRAHHAGFLLAGGSLDEELLRHSCDTPICVTVEHLLPGTHADNVRDRVERNRSASGLRNGRARLGPEAIREIQESAVSVTALAKKFGVDCRAIRYHQQKIQ